MGRRNKFTSKSKMTTNQASQINNALSAITSRLALANGLGLSFTDNKRDVYKSCGYKKVLTYDDYRMQYDREDIGRTIITAFANATWKVAPEISENEKIEEDSTKFEKDWNSLLKKLPVFTYLNRADCLCGIGSYGVIFLGVNDGKDFIEPVESASELVYMRTLSEGSVTIDKLNEDMNNERFGQPEYYQVTFGNMGGSTQTEQFNSTVTKRVHWSRIVHIADNKDESDIYGVPRLQPVYNRLYDCHKVLGCSAEMFWLGAFQGLAFEADAEATDIDTTALAESIEKYVHGLQRYMALQGVKTKQLAPAVSSPKTHIEVQLQFISAFSRIPVRILTGSERGELASSQDSSEWDDRVEERRNRFVTDEILKPFINRLIDFGVLSEPKKEKYDYMIKWPNIDAPSEKDKIELAKLKTEAMKIYLDGGVDALIPYEHYLEKEMGYTEDEITEFKKEIEFKIKAEEKEANKLQDDMAELQMGQFKLNPPVQEDVSPQQVPPQQFAKVTRRK